MEEKLTEPTLERKVSKSIAKSSLFFSFFIFLFHITLLVQEYFLIYPKLQSFVGCNLQKRNYIAILLCVQLHYVYTDIKVN